MDPGGKDATNMHTSSGFHRLRETTSQRKLASQWKTELQILASGQTTYKSHRHNTTRKRLNRMLYRRRKSRWRERRKDPRLYELFGIQIERIYEEAA